MLEKTEGAIKNGQSRHLEHWPHKTQDEDKQNKAKLAKHGKRLATWTALK